MSVELYVRESICKPHILRAAYSRRQRPQVTTCLRCCQRRRTSSTL